MRSSTKMPCQTMNISTVHSRRLWSDGARAVIVEHLLDRRALSKMWSVCDSAICRCAQSKSSVPRSQCRSGTGNPSFARCRTWCRHDALQRLPQCVLGGVRGDLLIEWQRVLRDPNTSGSRNGTRSSSELAIVILSALTRMSPRSQVNRSRCCIRATGSQSRGLRVDRRGDVLVRPLGAEVAQDRAQLSVVEAAGVAVVALLEGHRAAVQQALAACAVGDAIRQRAARPGAVPGEYSKGLSDNGSR